MPTMKKNATNLLDSTGHEWFRQKVIGGHMIYNKEVCQLAAMADDVTIRARVLTGDGPGNVLIPKRDIPGFSALAYPQLGYRRMYGHMASYIEYNPNGHGQGKRGLRAASVHVVLSPASQLLANHYPQASRGKYRPNDEIMVAVFKPEYDKVQDLDKLINGDKLQVILNHDVLIEPSIMPEDDDYVVYCRQRACGRFNNKKEFKWYSDTYKDAVLPLLGNYGVHK